MEENIGEYLYDLGVGKDFLTKPQEHYHENKFYTCDCFVYTILCLLQWQTFLSRLIPSFGKNVGQNNTRDCWRLYILQPV